MTILFPIIALVIGLIIGMFFQFQLTPQQSQYLAVACLAGLDSVLGGIKANYEGKFQNDVFITGFFANVMIAWGIAWLGDQLFLNLYVVVALIMGGRIFQNLSLIRRYLLTQFTDWRAKQRDLRAQSAAESTEAAVREG